MRREAGTKSFVGRYLIALIAAVIAIFSAVPAYSDVYDIGACPDGQYQGVLDASDDTFGRPITNFNIEQSGICSASTFNGYEYDLYRFQIYGNSFYLKVETISGGDTYLAVYQRPDGGPNPFSGPGSTGATTCINCIAANDDGGSGLLSEITLNNMREGWVEVIVSSFSSNPSGAYTLDIDSECGGVIPAISEKGIIAMLLLIFGSAVLVLRNRAIFG